MSKSIFGKLTKYLLYLTVGLTPLFLLPFSQSVLSLPKRFLVLVLVTLSLGAWMIKQKIRDELRLRKVSKLLYWAAGFMLIAFVASTVFSSWMGLSFWGTPYSVADSLLTLFILVSLSFLIINSFKEEEYVNLLYLLIGSVSLVSLFAVLQLYGASLGAVSSLVGSYNVAAIFAAVMLPLALSLLFHTEGKKTFLAVSSLVLLLAVTLINFKAAWLVLILGVLVSLFFSTWNNEKMKLGWVASLVGCLALGIFFYLFTFSFPGFPARPPEVSLSLSSEYNIVRGVLNEGFNSKLLGAGPATFVFKYSQHHSKLLNQTAFWGTRFKQGSSVFWDWVVTKGILGALSLITLMGVVLWKGLKKLMRIEKSKWGVQLGLFSSFVSLIGAAFLYPFNFSLWFLFWSVLGILGGLLYLGVKRIDLNSKAVNTGYSLLLVLVIVLGVGLIFLQGVRYYAADQYKKGLRASRNGNIEKAINQTSRAAQLTSTTFNSPVDLYYRDLAQLYLRQSTQVAANKKNINPGLVQTSVSKGVKALNAATDIAPANSANWNVKGFFYRNLIGVKQAGNLSLKAYQKAAELEPNSPFAYTEIGRVNVLMAQQGSKKKKQAYNDASKALGKALKLKPDYAPAHYLRAVIYDQQGNLEQAIGNLKRAKASAGQDLGLTFQLGLLYWRNDQFKKAATVFKEAVKANSDYSNARYMLGLVYDKQGKKKKAQEQFEKVAELNPKNKRVERILSNLKQGKSALDGISTGTTTAPLEGTPQEIKE